jgi:hypothetical protein
MQGNNNKNRKLAKARHKAERKKAGRRERGSALLVCEGKCTEPFYLQGLLKHLDISSASVEIIEGQSNSNAVAVVNRARQRFDQVPRDRVFVVIDAEQADLPRALQQCVTPLQRENKKKVLPEVRIEPILSAPCFEVWLLLHFRFCDQPFNHFADVLPELEASLPDYQKNDPAIFLKVGGGEGLERALVNTVLLRNALTQTGAISPATDMDKLIEALRAIQA